MFFDPARQVNRTAELVGARIALYRSPCLTNCRNVYISTKSWLYLPLDTFRQFIETPLVQMHNRSMLRNVSGEDIHRQTYVPCISAKDFGQREGYNRIIILIPIPSAVGFSPTVINKSQPIESIESRLRDHTRTFDSDVRARSNSRRTSPAEGILKTFY
jgi:hypothetical protein